MACINTNPLQPTGFRLVIHRGNYPALELLVNGVNLPNVSMPETTNASYKRIGNVPFVGDKLVYGQIDFDVIMDEEMAAYSEIYNWMNRMTEENYIAPSQRTDTNLPFETDISLVILNSQNRQEKKIMYRNAFPVNLGSFRMEASTAGVVTINFPVTFAFTYFDIV